MSETLVVTLTLMTLVSILTMLVGGMIGWMAYNILMKPHHK